MRYLVENISLFLVERNCLGLDLRVKIFCCFSSPVILFVVQLQAVTIVPLV